MSKCFTLIQKNVKTEQGNISEHDCYNSRKQFFLIFAPVCSVLKNRNSKFHKAVVRAIYHRRDQYCLYMCVCVITGAPTHSTSTVPVSGTSRTLLGLVSPPKSCQASSPITRECPSICRRSHMPGNIQHKCTVKHRWWLSTEYLKTGCLGLAQPSLPLPQGSHTTQFRALLPSSRADPGFGLTHCRPHSLVLV